MKALFILLAAASSLLQSSAQDPSTAPKLSALDRATAQRNARHDNTRYDAFFRKYSKRYFGVGFDWAYFKAQGMAESELSATARSNVGARGVMQLMPSTFQAIQTKRPEFQSIDDPEWNIAAGIMHDRYLWQLWEPVGADSDRTRFMFGSYNAGEGTIARATATAHAKQLDELALAEHRARRAGSAPLALSRDARLREENQPRTTARCARPNRRARRRSRASPSARAVRRARA